MDCDLQDPPECIPALLARIQEGYDLVLARRKNRKHSLFRRVAAKAYGFFARRMNRESFEGSFGTLSILSRKVVRRVPRVQREGTALPLYLELARLSRREQ